MRGRIRDYSPEHRRGIITGSDGAPYGFSLSDWREAEPPLSGVDVDFVVVDGGATSVYRVAGAGHSGGAGFGSGDTRAAGIGAKSRGVAAALALFLGWTGAHKFYLGYTAQGMIMLITGFTSFMVLIWLVGSFREITVDVVGWVDSELRFGLWPLSDRERFLLISPTVVSAMLWSIFVSAMALFSVVAVSLTEFVTYFSMSDGDFDDVYVTGRRVWF